jgi:SAM-dependent methyltransferase
MLRRSHPRPPVAPQALNAPRGDTMWTNLGDWSAHTEYTEAAAALAARVGVAAALSADDVVVDYACGYGDSLRLWVERFGVRRAVGVEPDAEVCRRVEARIAQWGLGARIGIVRGHAETLRPRAADPAVTAVVAVDAAYHFAPRIGWWRMLAQDVPPGARIAATDLVLGDRARVGLALRALAWGMRLPSENLVHARTLQQSLTALGLDVSLTPLGDAVLDGFVRHAPPSATAVRVTRAAVGWARRRGLVDYALVRATLAKTQTSVRRAIGVLALAAAALWPLRAHAQADWETVQQPATWVNAFVDHAVTARTALWFDGHWRRMGLGAEPQQLLLRPGVQVTLRPGLRVGAGYAYIATAPYGESPNPRPVREHRAWQQLSLAHPLLNLALSHRLRVEQRWSAPLGVDGALGPRRYQQRLRYLIRAQRPVGARTYGFAANEFFLPVGHSEGAQRRLQNRAQLGIGLPITEHQRVEVGYLHQWNRITPRETHEFNHTLVLSWLWTARR